MNTRECNLIQEESFYAIQLSIYFIIIGIILIISTCLTLKKMRTSFGADCVNESKMIKFTLIVFSVSYVLRVTEDITFWYFENRVGNYGESSAHDFIKLASWLIWDLLPILCMYVVHFDNFNSFMNEEILYCEYSEENARSSMNSYAGLLFQDIESSNNEQDSLFKSNMVTSSCALNLESVAELSSSDSENETNHVSDPYTSRNNSSSVHKSKTLRKSKKK